MNLPAPEICERARQARDPRFDGRFFVGVLTTGIYCRPVCPARSPRRENVRFFASGAAAQIAGFRPCLRCKPDLQVPAAAGVHVSGAINRALRHVEAGFLNDRTSEALAAEVGLGVRQLNRLFQHELGTTPVAVARAVRLQTARRLLDNPGLRLADVAMHAGYGSVRRFNDEFRQVYHAAPRDIRRQGTAPAQGIRLILPVRQPYNRRWMLEFLAARGLGALECVEGSVYRRRVPLGSGAWANVSAELKDDGLIVTLPEGTDEPVHAILRRLRRIFDLEADGGAIDAHLRQDAWLAPWVASAPGLRVPGAWDGYETAVRAILGQQVSVLRARNLAQLLVDRFGAGGFPAPEVLANAEIAGLGAMPGARCDAVRRLAGAVAAGELILDECQDALALRNSLTAIKGIGDWTAGYIAMRVARDPDTFLPTDWVVRKALTDAPAGPSGQPMQWQPWRSYAVMVLWHKIGTQRSQIGKGSQGSQDWQVGQDRQDGET